MTLTLTLTLRDCEQVSDLTLFAYPEADHAEDKRVAPEIVKVLKGSKQVVPPELAQLAQEARAEARYRPHSRYQ